MFKEFCGMDVEVSFLKILDIKEVQGFMNRLQGLNFQILLHRYIEIEGKILQEVVEKECARNGIPSEAIIDHDLRKAVVDHHETYPFQTRLNLDLNREGSIGAFASGVYFSIHSTKKRREGMPNFGSAIAFSSEFDYPLRGYDLTYPAFVLFENSRWNHFSLGKKYKVMIVPVSKKICEASKIEVVDPSSPVSYYRKKYEGNLCAMLGVEKAMWAAQHESMLIDMIKR